ncbi:MAG: peptidoglycan DD-metalloendopeptidase family protein [Prevotellaceae bacterium]|jgi:septal ring factor EnvC (AmiA/AmiB activator)|nr:peptidoglycan DD-metalloendopeptidase family protein [Prevotellaceae bacterium]
MKLRTLLIACLWLCTTILTAQTLNVLEGQRTALQKQIQASEKLLNSATKSYTSQLNSLTLINGQISERQKLITLMTREVQALARQITSLNRQIRELESSLKDRRNKYDASVQYLRKNRTVQDQLLFIFSAENLNQAYRRLRYVREYATFQRLQGEEIQEKQLSLTRKREELTATRQKREALLKEQQGEKNTLETQVKEQRRILTNLQRRQRGLQDELSKQRRQAQQLNARIDALINAEIEKVNNRAATAEGRAPTPSPKDATPMKGFTMSKADRELSGSFVSNRGKLPVPVTGDFAITNRYGQYNVSGLRGVKLDNKGIDIQAQPGAQARAIFNGEVSAVFRFQGNGLYNVLVRHGNYISVYCNLSSTSVKQGDRVKTGQTLGRIFSDSRDGNRTVLHFQLRKERDQMNPEVWLDK